MADTDVVIPPKSMIRYLPIVCTLVLGAAISFYMYAVAEDWRQTKLLIEFKSRANGYSNALRNSLNEYLGISEFVKDYMISNEKVSRESFSQFAMSALERYPGVHALSWNPFVTDQARGDYVDQAKASGIHDFMFKERSGEGELVRAEQREGYVVVYYIEPLEKNRTALGFDIASSAVRRQAIDLAFDIGKPVATARITLVQETGNQFGTLILNPVYRKGLRLDTVDARRNSKKGLSVEVLRIGDAIEKGLSGFKDNDIKLYLYDVTRKNEGEGEFLYARPMTVSGAPEFPTYIDALEQRIHLTAKIDFAQRHWGLVLLPTGHFLASQQSRSSLIVLTLGMCMTLLLSIYLFKRITHLDEIEIRVQRETMAKKQLAESEKLHRATIENISDTVMITDDHGAFTYVCPTTEPIFGVTPEEVAALGNIRHLFGGLIFEFSELRRQKELRNIESIVSDRQGQEHFILVNVKMVFIKQGTIMYTCRDITDRKSAEDRLRESEERFKRLFEFAPLPYQSLDENGQILDVNQTWLDALGYRKVDVIGKNFEEFLNPEWKDHFKTNFPKFKAIGEILGIEFEMQKEDSTFISVRFDGKVGKDQAGNFIQIHCVFRDISKEIKLEKRVEEQQKAIRQSQKLDSIGYLAGGIAHDFNNILSSIIGFTELALEDVEKETPLEESLREIYIAGERARDLVKQILAFARQSDEELKPIRVAPIAEEALKLIRSTIPTSIEIRKKIESQSLIMGNATQLNQIFMNLCTNAAQAMEDHGGVMEICLKNITNTNTYTRIKSQSLRGLKPGEHIEITVSDTGVGIAPDIIESIFDPYFSTKPPGEGTGMGLATTHGIIKSYHGKINVSSKMGKGTVFTVYLPITKNRQVSSIYKETKLPAGNERILLVDDEVPIVQLLSKILKRLGYHVTARTSSLEALDLFSSKPTSFDLCITDMTMPRMDGDRLALEMMKIRPDIPVILCSGYSRRVSDDMSSKLGIKAFAYKPIVQAELASIVRMVLDQAKETIQR